MSFYCYNCGKEVEGKSKICTGCGVVFKAVRCSACGYSDHAAAFARGCPSCGKKNKDEVPESGKKPGKVPRRIISGKKYGIMTAVLLLVLALLLYFLVLPPG